MRKVYTILLVVLIIEFALVFICGPYSCEWGGQVYFYYGLFTLLIAALLILLKKELSLPKKLAYIIGACLLLAVAWIIGFMLGDFRIMCRLF